MIDALCVGHAAWDVTLPLDGYPAEDSKVEIPILAESGGGPAANAAYLLSQWGMRCAFAGVVGDDDYGRRVLREFEEIGTDLSGVERRPGYPTPLSVILVNERNGSRTIINRKAPTAPLARLPTEAAGWAPRVLLFDGHEPEASLAAIERFPRAKTVLDAGSLRDGTRLLAGRVDYLVASAKFARQVTGLARLESGEERAEAIAALYRLTGKPVVITLGPDGLVHGTDADCEHLPAFPAQAVDTTAAGDIFHGAFAYGVLAGMWWVELLRFASMAAALSVAVRGGRASIPALRDVQEALARGG